MTDQEKKGFKWPWDYFHFQTKGRESIFSRALRGRIMRIMIGEGMKGVRIYSDNIPAIAHRAVWFKFY